MRAGLIVVFAVTLVASDGRPEGLRYCCSGIVTSAAQAIRPAGIVTSAAQSIRPAGIVTSVAQAIRPAGIVTSAAQAIRPAGTVTSAAQAIRPAGIVTSAAQAIRPAGIVTSVAQAFRPAGLAGSNACLQDFPTTASPDPRATVVMCGLDNPRGLAIGAFALYVAEAGRGGLGLATRDCFTGQAGGMRCFGPTGAVSRLHDGTQERIAVGLPSHANLQGRQAIGPHDLALAGGADAAPALDRRPTADDCHPGCAYVTIGLQQPPEFRERHPFLADFARLIRIDAAGAWERVADVGAYETDHDPDQAYYAPPKLDTNPYGLLALPGDHAFLVADAGGNALLRIEADGGTSTYAVLPPHPAGSRDDSVPTTVERGPDGAYYLGELTGFPLVPGAANIYRLRGAGAVPEVCLSGFTQVMDIAFDRRGRLYVLELVGTLNRITPSRQVEAGDHGSGVLCAQYAAGDREILVAGLTSPSSVAVGPDDAVYVSNRGIFPSTGQVIRFDVGGR